MLHAPWYDKVRPTRARIFIKCSKRGGKHVFAVSTRGLRYHITVPNSCRLLLQSCSTRNIEGHKILRAKIVTRPCTRSKLRLATALVGSVAMPTRTAGIDTCSVRVRRWLSLNVPQGEVILCILRGRYDGVVLQQLQCESANGQVTPTCRSIASEQGMRQCVF